VELFYFGLILDYINATLNHGVGVTLFLTLVVVLGIFACRFARSLVGRIAEWMEHLEEQVAKLEKAWTLPDGSVVSHSACVTAVTESLREMREIATRFDAVFMEHHEATKRIANEDHWKNCELERCPQLHRLHFQLNEANRMTEELAARADESRAQTREAMHVLMRRFDDFASHAIAALRRNGH
jgi:hypothetical protein